MNSLLFAFLLVASPVFAQAQVDVSLEKSQYPSVSTRDVIAAALGNTRSRLAVPVLIGMFADGPERNEVWARS